MSHFIMTKDGSPRGEARRRLLLAREGTYHTSPATRDEPGEKARRLLFLTSQRHSARVRRLRTGIFAASGLLILLLAGVIIFNPFKNLPKNISIGAVQVEGTNVIVDRPKIDGLQQNGRPFEITARSGTEDILKPNILKLLAVKARITLADLSQLEVWAKDGVYDNQSDTVVLHGDVRIQNTGNYLIEMDQASLNFKTNVFFSDRFSSMRLTNAKIESDTITISNNGDHISFEGGVKSAFNAISGSPEKE